MMKRRTTDPRPAVVLAFLLGAVVLIHGFVAGVLALRHLLDVSLPKKEARRPEPIEVELEPAPRPRPQVVEIDRPERERRPERARFVSEFDSSVRRETQSRNKGLAPVVVASVDRPPRPERIEAPPRPRRPAPEPGVDLPEQRPSPLSMRPGQPRARTRPPAAKGPRRPPRRLSLRSLTPSDATLQRVLPTAFPDYLKDIDFGDRTLLNTKEWRFASFFNRVKRAVAQNWHPDREYSRRDPKGNVFGFKTRLTILHVILHADGRLKRVIIERPSGLDFLDDEAVAAFRRAAPFPNPPRRLVNPKTNQIAFRFGFIFEVTRTPSWRLFRLK